MILANKRTNCISASWHPKVKIGIGFLSVRFVCEYAHIGSITFPRVSERCTGVHFSLSSWLLLYSATFVSVVSLLYWAELTVIIPNSIIFINATGLRTVHSSGSQVWTEMQPISLDKSSAESCMQARQPGQAFILPPHSQSEVQSLQRLRYGFNLSTFSQTEHFELRAPLSKAIRVT